MGKIISFANQKGGVGKTTSAVNIAASLGVLGYNTLLVDLDPQGNATSGVGVAKKGLEKTIKDVLMGDISAKEAIIQTNFDKLSLIPANMSLAGTIAILIASVKAVRSYNVTPFFRTKEVENILENLPEVLYNAYNEKYNAKQINENVISAIITQAVLDVKAEEIITAFCKTDIDKNIKPEYKPYVTRLQAFIYKVCASVPEQLFMNALGKACNSINKYNERTNSNNTFMDKYLNYKLLEKLVQSKDVKLPQGMKTAYSRLTKFKNNNKKFDYIF